MASDRKVTRTRTRSQRRGRDGSTAAAALGCAIWTATFQGAVVHGANLPVPCVAGSCGNQATTFVAQGAATAVQAANTLTVNQTTTSALLNWQSFNIAANGTVTFKQPDAASLALNRIFQGDPSRILGVLNANGRIYLLNQNGIIFGAGAQVNVAGLLASSLDLSPQALQQGIAAAAASAAPAFQPYVDATGKPVKSGPVSVEAGAQINSPRGQVFLFAPTVTNDGQINTPDGQTILAAGQRVFLLASTDPNLRGLLVEVGDGGTVTNSASSPTVPAAQIIADRGNVTLAGAVVHQDGLISATTSVRANGSIRLQARDTPLATLTSVNELQASRGGELELGPGSQTTVSLDASSTDKTVDVNAQPQSLVDLSGKTITVADGAVVRATAGQITALAAANAGQATTQHLTATPDDSELLIANGALLDVSGATASLPMERNSLAVQLRGSELADSPLQRSGPLRSQTVYVDVRAYGTRADGSTWVGSPLANLAADVANISRGVQERNLNGGTIGLNSQGAVLVSQGATLNVSGGQINWQSGYVRTSQLLGADGRAYNVDAADPSLQYIGIAGPVTVTDQRWGVTQQYNPQGFGQGQYQAGYVEGRSAGAVNIIAPRVALDGNILGTVVRGPFQVRDPRTAFSGGQLIGSISDVVPGGATLTLGLATAASAGLPDYVVSNVDFAEGEVLGGPLSGPPAASSLPGLTDIRLRPDLFGSGAVENLTIYANGTVNLASGSALSLQTGSTLAVNAGQIHVNSDLIAPSGSISLIARVSRDFPAAGPATMTGLSVAPGVSILVDGQWVNDNATLGVPTFAPRYINGGSVSLTASNGSASLGTGGLIDVSGGAYMTAGGALVAGRAGSISIGTSSATAAQTSLSLGKDLRGFGVGSGGSLSVSANLICIAQESCSTAPNQLQLLPSWFNAGGFANIAVASDLGPLEVLSGTVLNLRQDNFVLTAAALTAPSGTPMTRISQTEELPIGVRQPVNLTLNGSYLPTAFIASGTLQIDRGAQILADPLANVSLVSNTRILMDGAVSAPGGNISLLLNAKPKTDYLPDQAIWLGPDARLDSAGTAIYQPPIFLPNGTAVLSGSVLNGGTVQISAQRGYVFTDPASVIDVSGASAPLDLLTLNGIYQRHTIGSNGGSIGFFAVEGMQLNAQLAAHSGGTSGAMGGSLSVALDPSQSKGTPQGGYPTGDHDVVIAAAPAPFVVAEGTAAPVQLQGSARLPASLISQGGFDQITLSARNQIVLDPNTGDPILVGYGGVLFESGISLHPAARLTVDAPVIGVTGRGVVDLRAAYVGLGTSDSSAVDVMAQSVPSPVAGPGVLSVSGDFVDLIGNVSVKGASDVRLRSTGDIRARGVFSPADSNFDGQLSVAGSIDLTAQQIYPATLSNYAFNANDGSGTITTHATSGAAADVLSAGGTLTLSAAEIDNGGTLRAPLGTLQLVAPTINALPGSLLSTSLNGETVLFGQTQGGLAWTYPLTTGVRVYNSSGVPLPSQNIILQGATINLARGSAVDVSGGGDLLAYEFVPGPGGTRDILAPSVLPNQFAIIPGLRASLAPFDPLESIGSTIKPGEQLYLGGGAGLAAGYYTLLPARYALLPGAYLVRSVAGYQDLPAGATVSALDGGTIVSGRLGVAGTPFVDARSSGYEIQPVSVALLDAQYTVSLAGTFFSSASTTTAAAAARPLLPQDAGAVSVIASSSFILDALLKANVASAGRGAALQLAGSELLVTSDPSHAPAGVVAVTPAQIDAFGAQTLIIGGQRQNTPSGVGLSVSASSVEIASGTQLSGPDLILVARDLLKLDDGSKINATGSLAGAADSVLQLDANSSLLRVSLAPQVTVTRGSGGTGAGLVQFAASARIQSPDSVALDAGVSAQTSNSFEVTGSLSLAAPTIAIGNAPSSFAGIVLDPTRAGTAGVSELILTGRNSIDLFPGASFTTKSLTLTTPVVRAVTTGVTAQLNADLMQLAGTPGSVTGAAAGSQGSLSLSAREIDVTGPISLLGFDNATLSASEQLRAIGPGVLSTAGSLALSTGWVTSASGINYAVTAQGAMTLRASPASAPPAMGLGGGFSLSAGSISGDVRVAEPSGQIELAATSAGGNVSLGGATLLTVAGHAQSLGGQQFGAPGGAITLAATQGSISISSGASIDVSAVGNGVSAGSITLSAPAGAVAVAGSVNGAGTSGAAGGTLNLDAQAFDFASVLAAFSTGGFSGDWSVHLGGAGNLTVPSTSQLRLTSLELTADAGAIDIAGQINADGHRGGHVELNASGPITVEGTISARATDAGSRGGEITLSSGSGILLQSGSSIDVSGTTALDPALPAGGLLDLRLPRPSVLTLLGSNPNNDLLRLAGSISGARQVSVEGYQTYQVANAQIGAGQVSADASNPWYADAVSFASQAPQVLAALGKAGDARYQVIPGIEVDSVGDLHLAAEWNLYNWRFNGLPGVLTLRAGGNLYIDNSLNDGFTDSANFILPTAASPSWSYRLTAGALLTSADPLATVQGRDLPGSGSLIIAPGQPAAFFSPGVPISIRTGTGLIDVAAANDVQFGNQASVIYTAGIAGPGIRLADDQSLGGLNDLPYPFNGGDISISAGRDIVGAQSGQLYTEWLWRAGAVDAIIPHSTAWTVAFDQFEQGIATLGGGNIAVRAGRDIIDLSASTPSIGRQIGGVDPPSSVVQVTGGGDLTVTAGRDLLGGTYYSDLGVSQITAGRLIGPSAGQQGRPALAPVLAIGAGSMQAQAGQGLAIATIVNPTLLDVSQQVPSGPRTYLSTYTDNTSVSLRTVSGELDLMGNQLDLLHRFPDYPSGGVGSSTTALKVLPPSVSALDLAGSIRVAGSMSLWPAPRGSLQLIAADNVELESVSSGENLQVLVSDAAPASLPSLAMPVSTLDTVGALLQQFTRADPRFDAPQPVHDSVIGGFDPNPILIVANSGDVSMQIANAGKTGLLFAPKPIDVYAGEDIVNFSAEIQNLRPASVSSLTAGRDFLYQIARDRSGNVEVASGGITVDGPGRVEVIAGRNVNLAASRGIVTQGSLGNRALSGSGANVSIWAGMEGQEPGYSAFINRYLEQSDDYDSLLESYVLQYQSGGSLSKSAALQAFLSFDLSRQRGLLEQILFAELRAGGRAAAAAGPTHGDFTRAFTALDTLFPGSNPDLAAGQTNAYSGDILLYFSRIYTLAGGDINLIAPGGQINVGLAIAPSSFGITKSAAQLGLVAQSTGSLSALSYSDFQVNQSRAFAADGGNILVWSTEGNIDAGRGAKTAISAPPPVITIDAQGQVQVVFPAALSGSGIQTLATTVGRQPGDVDLFAPRGVVNANDAGIIAGNLTIAATAVLGANNITVSGTSVGVPVETGGLGASLVGAASNAASASTAAEASVSNVAQQKESPRADSALSWLDVFVIGFGEETCKADDVECLKRQKTK